MSDRYASCMGKVERALEDAARWADAAFVASEPKSPERTEAAYYTKAITRMLKRLHESNETRESDESALKALLRERGITQMGLAETLHTKISNISRWVANGLPAARIPQVAEVLGMTPDELAEALGK